MPAHFTPSPVLGEGPRRLLVAFRSLSSGAPSGDFVAMALHLRTNDVHLTDGRGRTLLVMRHR